MGDKRVCMSAAEFTEVVAAFRDLLEWAGSLWERAHDADSFAYDEPPDEGPNPYSRDGWDTLFDHWEAVYRRLAQRRRETGA